MDKRIERARLIVDQEVQAIQAAAAKLSDSFVRIVEMILALQGRVVVTGMGKAGIIAQKASASFASTGTPSIFLHPAEAIHGDLGRVGKADLLLALSKSGETREVVRLIEPVKATGVPIAALTESRDSTLGRHADVVLEMGTVDEAGTYKLAPSASTAAMLVICDALFLVVQEGRNFGPNEFAKFHPGGELGRKLLKVEDIMRRAERNPVVGSLSTVLQAMETMSRTPGRPGCTSVVDGSQQLVGFFTDGDLRRLLVSGRGADLGKVSIESVMTRSPKTIAGERLAAEALKILHEHHIDQIPVTDAGGRVLGLVDVQDILDLKID